MCGRRPRQCSKYFTEQFSTNHTRLFKDDSRDMWQWIASKPTRFKAHSVLDATIFCHNFIIDWCIFKQLVDSDAVRLQCSRQLLANVVDCLISISTDYNGRCPSSKMLSAICQWPHMCSLLQSANELLCNCCLTSTCCTNKAE